MHIPHLVVIKPRRDPEELHSFFNEIEEHLVSAGYDDVKTPERISPEEAIAWLACVRAAVESLKKKVAHLTGEEILRSWETSYTMVRLYSLIYGSTKAPEPVAFVISEDGWEIKSGLELSENDLFDADLYIIDTHY